MLVCFNIHAVTIGCRYCGDLIAKDKSVECGNIGTYYAQETGPAPASAAGEGALDSSRLLPYYYVIRYIVRHNSEGSMNTQQGPMTEAMYYVLLALTKPGHGYRLMGEVEKVSGGRVSMGPGTLYGVLTRMKKEGLILLTEDDGRRKVYRITAAGREALAREYARLKAMVADGRQMEEDSDAQA